MGCPRPTWPSCVGTSLRWRRERSWHERCDEDGHDAYADSGALFWSWAGGSWAGGRFTLCGAAIAIGVLQRPWRLRYRQVLRFRRHRSAAVRHGTAGLLPNDLHCAGATVAVQSDGPLRTVNVGEDLSLLILGSEPWSVSVLADLSRRGFHIRLARNTCGSVCARLANPEAILLDVDSQDYDAIEVLQRLRDCGVEAPVLLYTDHASRAAVLALGRAGAVACIDKPANAAAIAQATTEAVSTHGNACRRLIAQLAATQHQQKPATLLRSLLLASVEPRTDLIAFRQICRAAQLTASGHSELIRETLLEASRIRLTLAPELAGVFSSLERTLCDRCQVPRSSV